MPRGDKLEAFAENRLSQHRGGRGTVTCHIVSLAGGFLDELGPHVLDGASQFDVLGDGHAVLGHIGAAPTLVENRIATARPEGGSYRTGQLAGTGQQLLPGVIAINQVLRSHRLYSSTRLLLRGLTQTASGHIHHREAPWFPVRFQHADSSSLPCTRVCQCNQRAIRRTSGLGLSQSGAIHAVLRCLARELAPIRNCKMPFHPPILPANLTPRRKTGSPLLASPATLAPSVSPGIHQCPHPLRPGLSQRHRTETCWIPLHRW